MRWNTNKREMYLGFSSVAWKDFFIKSSHMSLHWTTAFDLAIDSFEELLAISLKLYFLHFLYLMYFFLLCFLHFSQNIVKYWVTLTAWKVSKYGVFPGPNTGKYVEEKTPYLDIFYAVPISSRLYPPTATRTLVFLEKFFLDLIN